MVVDLDLRAMKEVRKAHGGKQKNRETDEESTSEVACLRFDGIEENCI